MDNAAQAEAIKSIDGSGHSHVTADDFSDQFSSLAKYATNAD